MPTNGQTAKNEIVHVLFNGLFFLEFKDNKLIATTPIVKHGKVSAHEYFLGVPSNRVSWTTDIDLSGVLIGGSIQAFPQAMPQFSAGATQVGGLNVKPAARTVTLPQPIAIFPLRVGNFKDFPGLPGHVFSNMETFANGQFSMVTCLRYELPAANRKDWPAGPENKCHFYAEPHCDPGDHHLAMALKASKAVFTNHKAFDLAVDPNAHPAPIPVVNPGLGFGLDQSDEESLSELNDCAGGTNPADCGQMGVGHP